MTSPKLKDLPFKKRTRDEVVLDSLFSMVPGLLKHILYITSLQEEPECLEIGHDYCREVEQSLDEA